MASLLDIAGIARKVLVRDVEVDVTGISGHSIASLMTRFPEVGKMLSGLSVDRTALAKLAPAALAAVIAAGTGHAGDKKHEEVAASLSVGEQLDLLDEIFKLTFPRGVGPFVEKLEAMGVLGAAAAQTPSTTSSANTSTSSVATDTETH